FYESMLKARETGGQVSRDALLANAILNRIADEIQHACDFVPGDGLGFSGTHDRIVIIRTKMPEPYAFDKHDSIADVLPPGQLDISRITYELVWDDQQHDENGQKVCHGLLRSEQRTFDPNPTVVVNTNANDSLGLPQDESDSQENNANADGTQPDASAPQ